MKQGCKPSAPRADRTSRPFRKALCVNNCSKGRPLRRELDVSVGSPVGLTPRRSPRERILKACVASQVDEVAEVRQGIGAVAAEGRSADAQESRVVDAAAVALGSIVGHGAAGDRRRACRIVVEAAAEDAGRVAGEGAVADHQYPTVVDAAAEAALDAELEVEAADGGVAG